jgi:hypothetical protein
MPHRDTTKPFIFFFLVLPYGISSGFVSITLPFVLTRRLFGGDRFAIGRGAASTKYAALSSLGNVPVVCMTAVDGWVHDRFGTGWMLQTDSLSAIVFVVVALFVLRKINAARAQGLTEDNGRVG